MEDNKKMTYEQLENVAHQLSEQVRQLHQQLQNVNMTNSFKRLDYLFKILEVEEVFDVKFVQKCTQEIVEIMTIPEGDCPEDLMPTDSTENL